MLVAASVSWRQKVLFNGGLDPVVVAKAALSVVAMVIAWQARQRVIAPRRVDGRCLVLLAAYLSVSVFGAWSFRDVLPTAILVLRVLVLTTAAVLLAQTYRAERLIGSLLGAMVGIGLIGAVTGIPNLLRNGRLEGGFPPLNANEIAMLLGLPVVGLIWMALNGRARRWQLALLSTCLGLVWLTGSRTALIAVAVAILVMVVQIRRMQPAVALLLTVALTAATSILIATNVVSSFLGRGGDANVMTLSSRTIAWTAAFSFPNDNWTRFFGAGLATKKVPVLGQYWSDQLLDSSWVSALVQAGYLGVLIFAFWALWVLVRAVRLPRLARMFFLPTLMLLLIRSALESGLLDSSPDFLMFLVVSLVIGQSAGRRSQPTEQVTPADTNKDGRRLL